MEALEADGTTTGAEDLTWRTQRNAINPYAKQKFPHERAESRPECRSIECKRSESGSESESKSESASESESGSENANELKLKGRDYE
jgi:hypothetical protein